MRIYEELFIVRPDITEEEADHIVDMGPKAGKAGGEVVFEGSFADLKHVDTLTGRYLDRTLPIKENVSVRYGWAIILPK